MKKVNRLIMINILKVIGIILITYGKESNPLFLKNCSIPCTYRTLLDSGDTITNPHDITNTFNNYFTSIA